VFNGGSNSFGAFRQVLEGAMHLLDVIGQEKHYRLWSKKFTQIMY
jgi:hypothetical protein